MQHYVNYFRSTNQFKIGQYLEIFEMIWVGNTKNAYIIPESFTSLLVMNHLRPNGRPMFHVIKERVGKITIIF